MYYDKKIHELELIAGAYRYLEELAKKYTAKYKNFDTYKFNIDPCAYNISIPELTITFTRLKDITMVFRLKGIIKYTEGKFHYEICHFNHKEDKDFACKNEADMIGKFEKLLKADCEYVIQQAKKKTLKAINSLAG